MIIGWLLLVVFEEIDIEKSEKIKTKIRFC